MSEAQLRIGWYCPYSLVPLLGNKHVQPVRIDWDEYPQGYLGTTKLCKKLTGIHAFIQGTGLDGFILQICCNLSQYTHAYFLSEYRQFSFYLMEFPRKENACLGKILDSSWADIDHWLVRVPKTSNLVTNMANLDWKSRVNESGFRNINDNPWCKLSEGMISKLSGMERRRQKELLLNEVRCPKLIAGETREITARTVLGRLQDDDGCLLQDYLAVTNYE